jgi:glutaconate CoA-transferase, subunit A
MGAPFLPVRGILGSIYPEVNACFKTIPDPFSGEDLVAVKALQPDVTLLHGGIGDEEGNLLISRLSDWKLAINASCTVLATVEERVAGPLREDADWRLIPSIRLSALVHCPGGAAPTGFPGYYQQDEAEIARYLKSAKDPAAWETYLQDYVFQRKD